MRAYDKLYIDTGIEATDLAKGLILGVTEGIDKDLSFIEKDEYPPKIDEKWAKLAKDAVDRLEKAHNDNPSRKEKPKPEPARGAMIAP